MLLGCSDGSKLPLFVVFKTQRSTVTGRHEENLRERHGFGKTIWRELKPLERGMQIHGNANGWYTYVLSFMMAVIL